MVQTNAVRHLQDLPQPNATVVSQDHVAVIYRHPRNNHNNNQNEPRGNQVIKKPTKVLGLIHVAMGVILFAISLSYLQVGAMDHLAYGDYFTWSISGIVAGIFNITNGILGLFSSRNRRNNLLNDWNIGFSIMSCWLAVFNIAFFGFSMGIISTCHTKIDPSPFTNDGEVCKQRVLGISLLLSLMIVSLLELFVSFMSLIFACHFYKSEEEFYPFQKNHQYNVIPDDAEAENITRDNILNYGSHQNGRAVERQDVVQNWNGAERVRRPYSITSAGPNGEATADYIVHNREITSERQEGPLENPPPYPYVVSQNLPSTSRDFLDQPPSYMDQAKQQ